MERPKSSIARGKSYGHRNLKYIKRMPNSHLESGERIEMRTQILKKPEVLLL